MSILTLKIIAIVTMIIDHVGFYFFSDCALFRVIGRLSFPIFAWLIANGAKHTKSVDKYILRLLIFGVISQIPYAITTKMVGFNPGLNVLFTLSFGLVGIKLYETTRSIIPALLLAVLSVFVDTDYNIIGVLSVLFFYIYAADKKLTYFSQAFLYFVSWYFFIFVGLVPAEPLAFIQPVSLLSLLLIGMTTSKDKPKGKWLFYIFYPLQFVVFYFILKLQIFL